MCATGRIFPAKAWDENSSLAAAREALELLLAESLRLAHESGALRSKDQARVTVDTTMQPKNIAFPTDAKLLHEAIKGLNPPGQQARSAAAAILCPYRQARAILSAVGYNFRRILVWLRVLLRLFLIAFLRLLISRSTLNPACSRTTR
jgi:hypothetical protein